MTDTPTPAPAAPARRADSAAETCGSCGAAVAGTDATCPACGALLAAYRAPDGASAVPGAIQPASMPFAPASVPVVTTPPASPPPADAARRPVTPPSGAGSPPPTRPRSLSPVGDALDRIEASGSSIGTGADGASSEDLASELAKMAENDSDLARAVDARLRGARVRFDGTSPTIATEPEPAETPSPEHAPALPPPTVASAAGTLPSRDGNDPARSDRTRRAQLRSAARAPRPDVRTAGQALPIAPSGPLDDGLEDLPPASGTMWPSTGSIVRAIPFVLIVLFLVIGVNDPGALFGAVVLFVLGGLVLAGVLYASGRVGRKTTSMPRDDRWNQR